MQYRTKNLAIVIPTNGSKSILSVLKSIKSQTNKPGLKYNNSKSKKKFNFSLKLTLVFLKKVTKYIKISY